MKQWRISLILFFIFIFAAAIVGRLIFLQIIQYDYYAALATGQQKFFTNLQGDRGEIFFQNHDLPIATNKTISFVYISPQEIVPSQRTEIVKTLSDILGLDYDLISNKIQKNSLYELVKEQITDEELALLQAQNLKGIHIGQEKIRSYPYEDFASHLLGFVNRDGMGQYGLEEYWQDILQGQEKLWQGERGLLGSFFSRKELSESKGSDLFLTIDYNIQYLAEKLLKRAGQQLNIQEGTIIVMEPQTGRILALADYPNFNPNQYYEEDNFGIFQTDAIQKIFEPGSVFKPLTMAAALNERVITPKTTYRDLGVLEIGGWPIYNYERRTYSGEISMTEVLEKSINTGAVFAQKQLGNLNFLKYIERFGIFEATDIDLAGEVFSQNKELKKGYEINFATASFGQGIEMTPLQLMRAFAAIANGGKLIKPYIVEKIKNSHNEISEIKPEIQSLNIISPETSSQITTMLVSVVENGFGKAARIPGYYIAGKTGTAQVSFTALGINKEGYSEKTWQSFIGFSPAFDSKFIILVKLNNPATKTAEYSAVPIFRELVKYIIDYYQIPPDYEPR